ncbi:arsenic resistance protein [Corynebacterium sp.]|uniref:arsenic resistance protein n=1 Tax=Corynebacterium sp. TaxID=1720 RepID=UPI003B3A7065
MDNLVSVMERRQIPLYLAALLVGGAVGLLFPGVSDGASSAVSPVLALLLYATFLGIPLRRVWASLRDGRFLVTVAVVNFVVAPAVAWLVTRPVASDEVLLVGALFVLLAPCIDYVIVFTGLAGGAADRLLATTPLLMLVQMALLPVFLWAFLGTGVVADIDPVPFVEAFVVLILLPLCAAGLTQLVPSPAGDRVRGTVGAAMVPLMMLTLAGVVAAQIAEVNRQWSSLVRVVPVYVLFALAMTAAGWAVGWTAGRLWGTGPAARRALVFTGVTRNSLVVLPLVLALPAGYDLAPLVVVTQTLVELVVMVVFVRLVPLLVPLRGAEPPGRS